MPLVILGMHRSGTSMITRLLYKIGLDLGTQDDIATASETTVSDNPEGYWEHDQFRDLNEDLLVHAGGSWKNPPDWSGDWTADPTLQPFYDRAAAVVEGFQSPIWGWKDPRTCLTLPFWQKVLPDLKLLVCVRHPVEVALSFERRVEWSLTFDQAMNLWQQYHQAMLPSLADNPSLVTHHRTYFYDAEAELRRVAAFAGLSMDDDQIKQATQTIRLDLHRNFASARQLSQRDIPGEIEAIYDHLCAEAGPVYHRLNEDRAYQLTIAEDKLEAIQSRLASVQLEHVALQKEQARIIAEKANLEAEKAAFQEEKAALQEEKATLEAQNTQLTAEHHHLLEAHQTLHEVYAQSQDQLAQLHKDAQQHIRSLETQVQSLELFRQNIEASNWWPVIQAWGRLRQKINLNR